MPQNATPSVQMQTPAVNPASQSQVPFRAATIERTDTLTSFGPTAISSSTVRQEKTVEGSGYIYAILADVQATGATSTAASIAAYAEDAPFNVIDTLVLRDVNGEIVSLQGFHAWVANLCDGYAKSTPATANAPGNALPSSTGTGGTGTPASQDTNMVQNVGAVGTASTGTAAGGNFRFPLRVPVATNRRDLLGILANQDRAQKYALRMDQASTSTVFSTAPSSVPNITMNLFYEQYSVPLANAPDGSPQEQFPPTFGTVHFTSQTVSEAAPSNGSKIPHYIRRVGNTMRWVALVFRSTTTGGGTALRGNADVNPPSNIQLKLGEDSVFNESWTYRRNLMFERLGFDMPRGVLLYDWIHDFGPFAGYELGDDLVHSQALVNAAFSVTYPSTASTWQAGSSLTFITDDLIFSEPQIASVA